MKDYIGMGTYSWPNNHLKRDVEDILGSLGEAADHNGIGPVEGLRSTLKRYFLVITCSL